MTIAQSNTHLSPENIQNVKNAILHKLVFALGVEPREASKRNWLNAALRVVRDLSTESWLQTRRSQAANTSRRVYYLSMEFLMGRTFSNAMIAEGVYDLIRAAFDELGQNLEDIINEEGDPGLGNGGLGRLAACYMDSLAAMKIPAIGYGIRYEYGMFRQEIKNGEQVENPDYWLENEFAWPYLRSSKKFPVRFGGRTWQEGKKTVWQPDEEIIAQAHDQLVPGFKTTATNSLRLWSAHAGEKLFGLADFNRGDYFAAMSQQNSSENVSRVLYPDDSTYNGRELRLRQEYFLCSASVQDIVRRHEVESGSCLNFAEKVAIHLNDTHPTLAIPELMRILIDEKGYSWEQAWNTTRKVFFYTNHTLMSEALETWPVEMVARILPRHLQIIFEINDWFLQEVREQFPNDEELIRRVSIIDEQGDRRIRMAWLAVIASGKVNGVAKIHSDLMVESIFADFAKIYPDRFTNVTNGVTPRRWIHIANPGLASILDKRIGKEWRTDLTQLDKFNAFVDDADVQAEVAAVKVENKRKLAAYIEQTQGIKLNPEAIFDVQIKRIHKYKRQQLNVLHIIAHYNRILRNPTADWQPRVFIFAGKAASAYYAAKKVIRLINDVANVINNDSHIRDLIKVVFIPNYSVSLAQLIIPAADVSEQISLAGTEASGTSNMKFALNGALTIGTLDGANVEILDRVGNDNIFIFGNTVEQVEELRRNGYSPYHYYEKDAELNEAISQILNGKFSPEDPYRYQDLILSSGDFYQACADFRSYVDTQEKVATYFRNKKAWTRSAIINIANMGYFSSDRSVLDYAKDIWKIEPMNETQLSSQPKVADMMSNASKLLSYKMIL
ncbi:glycogen/starch/alpha-glucan family phosphorylase [Glaesserella parasuis]|uniref:glycogen/starch/alpha-glucan phosphorylase n=1 Tax=Glaesserella parasuis TaxID=738 RepID=UPI00132B4D26|nr:glycogen/starch/alpha-glucan phosphorylase [Glaesserella parasuis]MDG6248216.1 glycogen/starch/alpha-glucan phosphorylase [Glaesserella parasuis]MDO9648655.1 glycogen/starch/alpha-glucan phosphorylase [Glaesserella parasuis]MDO9962252.1 glycogen/starch/alpha-glucan phosphorylase [Glaesserella parasuis]MDO9964514.1 glycogen/starch/alpha-glucan phosphorylase [Glaesserella parasuis]MWQ28435.1 glycogen/starch/alpha-glucan phosphorylase [Glaesserella parasuis]